jgi:hypothetical protein
METFGTETPPEPSGMVPGGQRGEVVVRERAELVEVADDRESSCWTARQYALLLDDAGSSCLIRKIVTRTRSKPAKGASPWTLLGGGTVLAPRWQFPEARLCSAPIRGVWTTSIYVD